MSRYAHPDGPADYVEMGAGAPEPTTDTPCMFCGFVDPHHAAQCEASRGPLYEQTRAYYDAGPGHPCPVCAAPKPRHEPGCYEAGDYGPPYRPTPADFENPEWPL